MKIAVNMLFTEEEKQKYRDDYNSLYERVIGGECGDRVRRDIDEFYNCIIGKANKRVITRFSPSQLDENTSYYDYIDTLVRDFLDFLGILPSDELLRYIENKSYMYLPKPKVEIEENVVYIIMDGKEYKCIPTGRTEEMIIEEKAEALIKKREEEEKMSKRRRHGPQASSLTDILFG